MNQAQACAQKFAVYLHKNSHLKDGSISKIEARQIYNDNFKKDQTKKISFGSVFFHSLGLLKRQQNREVMCYDLNKVLRLLLKEANIYLQLDSKNSVLKNTVVSHSLSFHSGKKSEESVLSPKECKLCDVRFDKEENFKEHLGLEEHAFFDELKKSLKEPTKQSNLHFTIDDSPILNNIILRKDVPKTLLLKIKNTNKRPITISSVQTDTKTAEVAFHPSYPCQIDPSSTVEWSLTVQSQKEGVLYFPILFRAEDGQKDQQRAIELVFHVHDEFFDDLHPVEPYKRLTTPVVKEYIENVDTGERPNIFPKLKMSVRLKQYFLPVDVAVVLNAGLKPFEGISKKQQTQLEYVKNLLNVENKNRCLTAKNYTKLLDMLLYIEEHQMLKDIRDYDKEDQVLKKVGGLLELEVPGLAEHRPSIIFADAVFLRESKQSRTLYEGFVHQVKESSVLLKFSKRFMNAVFFKGKKFYVSFTFNRYPLRVEHQAVQFIRADNISHYVFPKKITTNLKENSQLVWFNKDIANNPEQQQAVRAILQKTAMPAPYLIFGPPGTGKTMTVVESVKQIFKRTNENVLICTPSNSAANEVTKRLIDTLACRDLFRYVAPSFPYQQQPKEIRKYTNYPGGTYYQPTMTEFAQYRVVITTLTSAAKLVNSGCPQGHFGYVFIDEAGQATESETLIPIARILTHHGSISGQIVLAGDPRQLGPVVHSTLAQEYGFGTSMLERLMDDCEPYKKNASNKYSPAALTKLLKNYRSHPVIMNQPNRLFYENELQTAGDDLMNVAMNWEGLPNQQFPLIFHSVVGVDQREKTSPSFFNIQEIQVVLDYLDKLIGCTMQGMVIREEHIGVISPYKKQSEKIRKSCSRKNYNDLLIGTVEQVQGQEKLIVIVSTVRSKSELLKFDYKFHLGFLDNPKRFNVAVTRAKALLIIVGNPNILQFDKHWRSLIEYCKNNDAFVGEKFDFSKSISENVDESLSDAQNMSLIDEDAEASTSLSQSNN